MYASARGPPPRPLPGNAAFPEYPEYVSVQDEEGTVQWGTPYRPDVHWDYMNTAVGEPYVAWEAGADPVAEWGKPSVHTWPPPMEKAWHGALDLAYSGGDGPDLSRSQAHRDDHRRHHHDHDHHLHHHHLRERLRRVPSPLAHRVARGFEWRGERWRALRPPARRPRWEEPEPGPRGGGPTLSAVMWPEDWDRDGSRVPSPSALPPEIYSPTSPPSPPMLASPLRGATTPPLSTPRPPPPPPPPAPPLATEAASPASSPGTSVDFSVSSTSTSDVPSSPSPGAAGPPSVPPEYDDEYITGKLTITIHGATNLRNPDSHANRHGMGTVQGGFADVYVRLVINGIKGPRTASAHHHMRPSWDDTLVAYIAGELPAVHLTVKDEAKFRDPDTWVGHSRAGYVHIDLRDYLYRPQEYFWLPIVGMHESSRLRLSVKFESAANCSSPAVPNQAFPMRSYCRVTLYADAHTGEAHPCHPQFPLTFAPRDCWADIHRSLNNAQKFIYITGWSVWTSLRLLRDPSGHHQGETLGELLKRKAAAGVCVRIMVWNDTTSVDNIVINSVASGTEHGLLGTHDNETCRFFKKSDVLCVKVKNRALGYRLTSRLHMGNVKRRTSAAARLARDACFSHHQKTIMCDAEGWPAAGTRGKRRLVAYLGGLDMTSGRYDDAGHSLFDTLTGVHAGDFYQNCVPLARQELGPRQPWHDIHSCLEGRIAWDVLRNFECRWKKQADPLFHRKIDHKSRLYDVAGDADIVAPEQDVVPDGPTWSVQLFRSIDENSALDVPDLVETGCQNAYIHAIWRAQRFIYIENQYFMGGATEWEGYNDYHNNVECKHRIPIELAMRIVTKIRQGQPFRVYVVLPLYPEGTAESISNQGILHWQAETFRMMYRKIAAALQRWGPPAARPTDYLVVFFLGAREPLPDDAPDPQTSASLRGRQRLLLATRRHMVYVHSKMAIFDDQYIIVGSANINQRSMDGARDTEIAIGAHEDGCTPAGGLGRGQVAGFRRSLWAEHCGGLHPEFEAPEEERCLLALQRMAEANWEAYISPEVQPLPHGHLCTYPYEVDEAGEVRPRVQFLPDLEPQKALMMGRPPPSLLHLLTT